MPDAPRSPTRGTTMDEVAQKALSELLAFKEGIGEMRANITNMAHDIKGLVQSMQNFVPRREIEQMQAGSLERAQVLHARIDNVEKMAAERATNDRVIAIADRVEQVRKGQEYL